jgi:tRNA-intron endonuclease
MELLTAGRVMVKGNRLKSQLAEKGYGEKKEGYLILDLKEALYLLERGKIELEDARGTAYDYEKLVRYASAREAKFHVKYAVFRDFRERGYCIKTGFKFGFDYRVYPKGKRVGEAHTEYVVHVTAQEERVAMPELSRMARMSQTLNTKVVIAVVDSEDDINYYQVKRILP